MPDFSVSFGQIRRIGRRLFDFFSHQLSLLFIFLNLFSLLLTLFYRVYLIIFSQILLAFLVFLPIAFSPGIAVTLKNSNKGEHSRKQQQSLKHKDQQNISLFSQSKVIVKQRKSKSINCRKLAKHCA